MPAALLSTIASVVSIFLRGKDGVTCKTYRDAPVSLASLRALAMALSEFGVKSVAKSIF